MTDLFREIAKAMGAALPGCQEIRLIARAGDGSKAVYTIPVGRWATFTAGQEAPSDDEIDQIVDVLEDAKRIMTAEEIASELGAKNDSRFRARLGGYVRDGRLKNHRPGYGLPDPVKPSQ